MTQQYDYGSRAESSWEPGAPYHYADPGGVSLVDGQVVEAAPPRRLVTTFRALFAPEAGEQPPTKLIWEIEPQGAVCTTFVHLGLEADNPMTRGIISGWNRILSGLKTLLETGQPLAIPA